MSDYTGPGIYELIPGHAPTRRVSVWGGESKVGAEVRLNTASPSAKLLWEIVAAGGDGGNPEVGDSQYHIIDVASGLMLCAAEDGSDSTCTISTRSVQHGSSRWKMIPATNGLYYFASVLNTERWLAVKGLKNEDGAEVMTWVKTLREHFQFKLKRPAVPA